MKNYLSIDSFFLRFTPLALAAVLGILQPEELTAGFVDQTAILAPDLADGNGAWGDYNRDGYPDLNLSAGVWRNQNGTNFIKLASYGPGPWGDVNNDGYLDLFRRTLPCRILLYDPDTDTFVLSDEPAVATPKSPSAACWADFHGDGFIDLYVCGYETWDTDYWPDSILSNRTDGTMSMVWEQTGDIDPARGATACDFDEDGDMDVYVSNYRLEANLLWRNNGDGTFVNVAKTYGVAGIYDGYSYSYGHTIGSAWGDLDNDGHFDLFVGNFSHTHEHQDRPMFYRNLGPAGGFHFEDKSATAGLAWQESFATPALGDYDNDGHLDLYFTTVYSGDYPVLYRNNGDWTFSNVTAQEGLAGIGSTYQAAWADIDNDGDLDLLTDGKLFINQGNDNNWMHLLLEGDGHRINRAAIGAQVRIEIEGSILTRQVEGGTGQGNQNDLRLHFGLGQRTEPVDAEIRWPDGSVQVVHALEVDRIHTINPGPLVVNGEAADITHEDVRLTGTVTSTGAGGTHVDVGVLLGTNANQLAYHAFGTVGAGEFSIPVANLQPNTVYYYRCSVSNAYGWAVAPELGVFTTPGVLPFVETFDPLKPGDLDLQNGWRTQVQDAALVQPEVTHNDSALAASCKDAEISHAFTDFDPPPVIWSDYYIRAQLTGDAAIQLASQATEGVAVGFMIDADSGFVVVLDGPTPRLLQNGSPVQEAEWTRFSMRVNYLTKQWDLWMNGVCLARDLAFASESVTRLNRFFLSCGATLEPTHFDDFRIGAVRPSDIAMVDDDGDGLDDDLEFFYFGDLHTSAGGPDDDVDGDGFIDRHELLAGTDPTDPDSLLQVSEFRVMPPSEALLSWRSVAGKHYQVQSSPGMSSPWNSIISNIVGMPPENQVMIPLISKTNAFFRVLLEH